MSLVEQIAIIGMGCRFPGGADTPAAFWRLLEQGRDAIRERPAGRPELFESIAGTPVAPTGPENGARQGGFLESATC